MNPEVKAKWIAALRSGDYTQGKGRLCTVDENGNKSYCCLGVLCDLAVREGIVGTRTRETLYPRPDYVSQLVFNEASAYLPDKVAEWADIPHDPVCDGLPLVAWNDGYNGTFAQIADLIETYQ